METPSYIRSLLRPNGKAPAGRKVWSIDLETVWLPFFMATNTMGETAIPAEALGAPLRLAYMPDGTVRFGKTGRPTIKTAKDIADAVKMVRENFTAGLLAYANGVIVENPEGYKAQAQASQEAGRPIREADKRALETALADAMAQALAEAEAKAQAKPKAKGKAKAEPVAEPELVGATA